jgi:uncharacterized repeat protein (TIGR03803 family)
MCALAVVASLYGTAAGGGPVSHGVGPEPRKLRRILKVNLLMQRKHSMQVAELPWVVCALTAMGMVRAQPVETVLHSFVTSSKGASPTAGVIRDSVGNLYGTTYYGDRGAGGVVYKVDRAGRETVLHHFTGGADGGNPYAGVIRDSVGNLYGTTFYGGTTNTGVVYKIDTAGKETVLYNFQGGTDGRYPFGGVVMDPAGNLYGTTYIGGTSGDGVVYKLDPAGNFSVLHNFSGSDGAFPFAGVILDSAGNLYGTNRLFGPTSFGGVLYKLDTSGNLTVLHNFSGGGVDGYGPQAEVISDSAGNLYGTTVYGGVGSANAGAVYKVDPTGLETVVYSFSGGADGAHPNSPVFRDAAGNLYGTTLSGGAANQGVVFKLDPTGQETVLYTFTGGADGGVPYAGVILDPAGNLFGTTYGGGANFGVVFKVKH